MLASEVAVKTTFGFVMVMLDATYVTPNEVGLSSDPSPSRLQMTPVALASLSTCATTLRLCPSNSENPAMGLKNTTVEGLEPLLLAPHACRTMTNASTKIKKRRESRPRGFEI